MGSIGFWRRGNGQKRILAWRAWCETTQEWQKKGREIQILHFCKMAVSLSPQDWLSWNLNCMSFSRFRYHFWHFQAPSQSVRVWPRKRREIQIVLYMVLWWRRDFGVLGMARVGFWCDGNGVKRPRSKRKRAGNSNFHFWKISHIFVTSGTIGPKF